MFVLRNNVEGPSSAKIEEGLRDIAQNLNLDIETHCITSGFWLWKTDNVYFKVQSEDREKLAQFQNEVSSIVRELNQKLAEIRSRY